MRKLRLLNSGMMWDTLQENLYKENDQGVWELHPEYIVISTNGNDEFVEYEGSDLAEALKHKGELRYNFTPYGYEVLDHGE